MNMNMPCVSALCDRVSQLSVTPPASPQFLPTTKFQQNAKFQLRRSDLRCLWKLQEVDFVYWMIDRIQKACFRNVFFLTSNHTVS